MFKVIVIDDDANLNFLIAKVLTKSGYQVFQCYNANDAYDVLFKIRDRMLNEVEGINRVLVDITPKPTGTIEWE